MDLYVAGGGGGDVLAAAMVQTAMGRAGDPLLCYSWDRLIYDPLPGPRSPADFVGLEPCGLLNHQVLASSAVVAPGRSTLPRLADELGSPLYLLDARGGAVGMAAQVQELVAILAPDAVHVVDVGGDVLATGDEPNLRSPLADSLALAATSTLRCPTDVLVAGLGLDGELSESQVLARCLALASNGSLHVRLSPEHVEGFARTMVWMPSEASALLWASAMGMRGPAQVRDHAALVVLTDRSPEVHRLDHDQVLSANRLATAILPASSLAEAEATIRRLGSPSEIDVERTKAATRRHQGSGLDPNALSACLDTLDRTAGSRGVAFVTIRHIAEHLGLAAPALDELVADLRKLAPDRCRPPLWLLIPSGTPQAPAPSL